MCCPERASAYVIEQVSSTHWLSFENIAIPTVRRLIAQFHIAVGIAHDVTIQMAGVGRALDNVFELLGGDGLIELGQRAAQSSRYR